MSGFKTFIAKYHYCDCVHIQEVRIQHFRFGLMLGPVYVKMKELDPVGGRAPENFVCRSANGMNDQMTMDPSETQISRSPFPYNDFFLI